MSNRRPNHHRTGIIGQDYPIDPYRPDLHKAFDPYDRDWRTGNPAKLTDEQDAARAQAVQDAARAQAVQDAKEARGGRDSAAAFRRGWHAAHHAAAQHTTYNEAYDAAYYAYCKAADYAGGGRTGNPKGRATRAVAKEALIGKRVMVYYNLHSSMWSVRLDGKVVLHTDYMLLSDAVFRVSESGRQRVLRDQAKNVHAFAVGTVVDYSLTPDEVPASPDPGFNIEITYNPYKYDSFVTTSAGEPVSSAAFLQMINRKVYAKGVQYNSGHRTGNPDDTGGFLWEFEGEPTTLQAMLEANPPGEPSNRLVRASIAHFMRAAQQPGFRRGAVLFGGGAGAEFVFSVRRAGEPAWSYDAQEEAAVPIEALIEADPSLLTARRPRH